MGKAPAFTQSVMSSDLLNMNKIEMCIQAINTIAKDPDGADEETVRELKDNFEIIFSDDEYFQKYRPTKYYLQAHDYYQKLFRLLKQEEPFDDKKIFAYGNLLPGKWGRRKLTDFIIDCFYESGNMEKMKEYIPKLAETETDYQGYRKLLKFYATKGRLEDSLSILKDCKPKESPKSQIEECKRLLIENFAANNGLEAAVELCGNKVFGAKYLFNALLPTARQIGYIGTQRLFFANKRFRQPEFRTYELVLMESYEADSSIHEREDIYQEIYELIDSIDKIIKWGDFKLRDWLLLKLASCLQRDDHQKYEKRITQCRKAIRNNSLKRELDSE